MPKAVDLFARFLRGFDPEPRFHVRLVRIYRVALGLVYLCAFGSLAVQWKGLIGSHGISPVGEFLEWLPHYGFLGRINQLPTLVWLSPTDGMLFFLCWAGIVVSLALIVGILPRASAWLLWIFYLSLANVGDVFLQYQWESLLLEAGFLAPFLFVRGEPPPFFVWLNRWLLFRLLFASGMAKILSGDPTWRDLSAMAYHFQTQPLPTPLAWYAQQLPAAIQKLCTLGTLAAEIVVPFLFFLPRRCRIVAFWIETTLQVSILLTGNYGYFNWLTIALALLLLDDDYLGEPHAPPTPRRYWGSSIAGGLIFIVTLGAVSQRENFLVDFASRFRIVSTYGLFAVMTTTRNEIVIEGSEDKKDWREYEFQDKPGDPKRAPPIVAPHLPRLDWQAWFAALSQFERESWLQRLLLGLFRGEKDVLALFERVPFEHPRYLRVRLYLYRFSDYATWKRDHVWWVRTLIGEYAPVLSLKSPK